ncbi:MAG: glycosyltransferase family 4 protein, partial [bacterium]
QWAPHLAAEGIEIVYEPFMDDALGALMKQPGHMARKAAGVLRGLSGRIASAFRASRFDAAYVFREGALMGPAIAERLLARSGVPYVYDFDDAVWVRYVSPANSYYSYLRFPGKTATLCRLATHVIAGNAYLQDYALAHNPRVSVVPTTIDTVQYQIVSRRVATRPVIGWTGSYSTVQYLALVRPALERLRARHDFRFVVVGGTGFAAAGVEVEHRPWVSTSEVEDLSDFDVGIMPLPDAVWERGKCGAKALQYMGLGIPVVVSPVGANTDIVRNDVNGCLASTTEEWEAALERLLLDPALRERLGREGRRTVEARYSALVHAPRVAAIFKGLRR